MLLIPLPQEDSVRRQPWITYGLIAANALLFLASDLGFDEREQRRLAGDALQEIAEHLAEHPYLDPPAAAVRYLDHEFLAELQQFRERVSAQRGSPLTSRRERAQQQLDSLVASFREQLDSSPYRRYGLVPARATPAAYLTSMFMHAGWLHLVGNMLFLYLSGPFVEDVFGRVLYPLLYLLGGIVASTAHVRNHPDSAVPLVGASGAIAAVMGAFLIRFAAKRIKLLVIPIPILPLVRFTTLLPAFLVLPAWLGEQVWYASSGGSGAGVAWWAHIGGFAFGVFVAVAVKLTRLEESWIHPAIEAKTSFEQHPGLVRAIEHRAAGELATARRELRRALSAQPGDLDVWAEAYELAVAEDSSEQAGQAAARLVDLYTRAGEKDLARQLVYEVPQRVQEPLPNRYHMAAAGFLERDGDARTALEHYQRIVDSEPDSGPAFRALFRQGEILRRAGDPRAARAAYTRARQHPACTPPWPESIDRALAELAD